MSHAQISLIGLGYVGLPLAVALARYYSCLGFDLDQSRIDELRRNHDRTGEIDSKRLEACTLALSSDPGDLPASDFFIVTVPTPIDAERKPDLSIVEAASRTVGSAIARSAEQGKKPIVIYESTVYPGVTEEICVPLLEEMSGLKWKSDFFVAYSPERINPGDREHTVDKITKVVSGDTSETLEKVAALYDAVTSGGVFRAASIKTAEAAKVIENAQRDINIAFMNEIALIFGELDLSVWDVLEAARTKWNFLPFAPGLVGGHCIGVDPYYLAHRASELGMDPKVILAGRNVNDAMAMSIARRLNDKLNGEASSILVLGLTFKENVPDLRNSKVADLVAELKKFGHSVTVHDPLANSEEARDEYGIKLDPDAFGSSYDMVLLAVPHEEYIDMGVETFDALLKPGGVLADLKNALSEPAAWTL